MKKKIFAYLRFVISIGLVSYFILSIDIHRILQPIAPSGWLYLALTFFLVNVDRLVMAYKWNILLKAKGIKLAFSEVVRSYYIGTFWGTFLPSSLGGDVIRAFKVQGQTDSTKEIFSSIILERVLGLVATFLMGMLSVSAFVTLINTGNWSIALSLIFLSLLFFGVIFLSFNPRLTRLFDQRFPLRNQGWMRKVIDISHAYQAYRNHRGPMVQFLLWSLLEQWIPILSAFLVAQALNLNVPFWSFFIFIPAIVALSRIPISLDGFGLREGLYIFFFSFVEVPVTEAFILGLLAHTIGIIGVLPGFFYYSFYSPSAAVIQRSLSN